MAKPKKHELRLRDDAEKKLSVKSDAFTEIRSKTTEELIHELRVHQIELEMMNEELRMANLASEAVKDKYLELYDFAPIGYFTFTRDAMISEVNLTGTSLLGVERRQLLNCRFRKFISSDYLELWDSHFMSVFQHEKKQSCDLEIRRADGSVFYAQLNSIRMDADDGKTLICCAISDITERKRAETERQKLEELLRQAHKMEAVGQLAGGVAHDFNNLLYVIRGNIEMIRDDVFENNSLRYQADEILKAVERAVTLIRQLLLFSRREAMQMKPIDLNILIDNLLKMIRRLIGEDILLNFRPGSDLKSVNADVGQMEQVIVNLCVNARDAMSDGGTITIETGNALIDADFCKEHGWAREGAFVCLTISDTGCGIPQELQERVFEPFFTTKEVGKGTGLGLAAVYGIVCSHEGMIHLHSEPGKAGTTFRIYLPAIDESVLSDAEAEKESKEISEYNRLILLAEDEEPLRNMLIKILTRSGYRVLSAADGQEAVRMFNEVPQQIDLALLDMVMPFLNGQKVCDHIRSIRPELPVIFMTGYNRDMLNRKLMLQKQCRIIYKPCNISELLKKIRLALANTGQTV
jgi:PAS domain S-box-containing protein